MWHHWDLESFQFTSAEDMPLIVCVWVWVSFPVFKNSHLGNVCLCVWHTYCRHTYLYRKYKRLWVTILAALMKLKTTHSYVICCDVTLVYIWPHPIHFFFPHMNSLWKSVDLLWVQWEGFLPVVLDYWHICIFQPLKSILTSWKFYLYFTH